jgi:putative membrane protein
MLWEILLATLIGILAGTLTGLIPGIHINLIGVLIISASTTLLFKIPSLYLVIFIVSMAITHTFLDFIPSIFLGCPDTDTELSVLPGHDLLKKGLGYEAILLSAYGSLAAIIIFAITAGPSILIMKKIFPIIKLAIPYLLIAASFLLIILERKKINALVVFGLTGFLGWAVLSFEFNEPLFPLLTGLFGSSMLLISIRNKTKIPKQKITKIKPKLKRPLIGAFLASPLCSFLPGLGSGQAAVIGNLIARQDRKGFLILLGATNTFVMVFSFLSLYAISRTRTGAALAIKELVNVPSVKIIILIVLVALLVGIVAFYLTKKVGIFFSNNINKINYTYLSLGTLSVLTILIGLISGWIGLIVFIISTITGIYCISLNVKRTNMMGCLLLPTILFYLI